MKKDILKEFVSENKDSFDEFEPSLDVLSRIQSQLGIEQTVAQPKAKVVSFKYWWAAAAVLVLVVGTIVFFQQNKTVDNQVAKKELPANVTPSGTIVDKDSVNTMPVEKAMASTSEKKKVKGAVTTIKEQETPINTVDTTNQLLASNNTDEQDWHTGLDKNNSASVRLKAVLASGKQSDLSITDLQLLANTMNNDESSNVRLAALDVLGKQSNQTDVKSLILQSVAKQDDPIVQMELLSLLTPDEATTVKKQLLAITQNPMSIEAVRDQAYAALLRSKTNF